MEYNQWGRGGIGRHDGLKIRCLVIGVRVQVPLSPDIKDIKIISIVLIEKKLYKKHLQIEGLLILKT